MQTELAIVESQSVNLPVMSYSEKISRRDYKQSQILRFLGDFEVFTTVQIVSLLLEISPSSARRALEQLVKSSMLIPELHYIDGHSVRIYGITHQALVVIDAEEEAPCFERGKTKSNYIKHKLENQRVRIILERMGASYISERKVRIIHRGLKKIPDGIGTFYLNDMRVPGARVGIEVETAPKSFKRLNAVYTNYLHTIEVDEEIDSVLYLYPNKFLKGAIKLHNSLISPDCPKRDNLQAARPFRYMLGALETFPQGIVFLDGTQVDFTAQVLPDTFE